MLNKDFLSDIIHTLNTIADNINTAGPSTTLEQGSVNIQDDAYNISYCFGFGEQGYMAYMWIIELEGEEELFVIDIMVGKEPNINNEKFFLTVLNWIRPLFFPTG